MNQEKVGLFISERRKEKKFTQKELADKLGVTDRSVSNWENGKCLPDYSLFPMLCKELSITLEELLAGEVKPKKNNNVIDYISYLSKKQKRKYIIGIFVVAIILILAFLITCYFINNFNKTIVYELSGESENFVYSDSLVLYSNNKNIITTGNINILNDEIKEEDIFLVKFISDDKVILSGNVFVNQATINIEDSGYNDLLSRETMDNINNWELVIIYRKNDEFYTEVMNLENSVIMRNNKFINFKAKAIGEDGYIIDTNNDFRYQLALRDYLLEKGYKENSENLWMWKDNYDDDGNLVTSLMINVFEGRLIYSIIEDSENYANVSYTFHYFSGPVDRVRSNSLSVDGLNNNEDFSFWFYINEEEVECGYGECPDDSWLIGKNFITTFEDIIYFEVNDE